MNKRIAFLTYFLLVVLFVLPVTADNQLKLGNIVDSKVIVFQGTRFDFREEKQFQKFVRVIRDDSKLYNKLHVFFNLSIDELWAKEHQQQYDTLVRLMSGINTAPQLEERLDEAEATQQDLLNRIAELEQQQNSDPGFKQVLTDARAILAKKDFIQYHRVLQSFADLRKQQLKQYKQEIAEAAYLRANEYATRLDFSQALIQIKESLQYDSGNNIYWTAYGNYLHIVAHDDEALKAHEKALTLAIEKYGEQDVVVADNYINLGSSYGNNGQSELAIKYLDKALEIYIKTPGENQMPAIALIYNNMAVTLSAQGYLNKSIEFLEKALSINLKLHEGKQHADIARIYYNLGAIWYNLGVSQFDINKIDRSTDYFEKALEIYLNQYGKQHPAVARTFNSLGEAWGIKGQLDRSIEYTEKALDINLKIFSEKHPVIVSCYVNLARAWGMKGEYGKAVEFYEKALVINKDLFGDEHSMNRKIEKNIELFLRLENDNREVE